MAAIKRGQQIPLSRRVFEKYDFDHSGSISPEEFREMTYEMGYYLTEDEYLMAVLMLDTDGDGSISYEEFKKWWCTDERFQKLQLSDKQLELLKHVSAYFQYWDKDSSGTLDREEFRACHADLVKNCVTDQAFEKCLANLDQDGNGVISHQEYIDWLISIGSISLAEDNTTQINNIGKDQIVEEDDDTEQIIEEMKNLQVEKKTSSTSSSSSSNSAKNNDDTKVKSISPSATLTAEQRKKVLETIERSKKQNPERLKRLETMKLQRLETIRMTAPKAIQQRISTEGEQQVKQKIRLMREQSEAVFKKQLDKNCKHNFKRYKFAKTTFCDYCTKQLWSLGRRGYRCVNCKYTIHGAACRRKCDPNYKPRRKRRSRSKSPSRKKK